MKKKHILIAVIIMAVIILGAVIASAIVCSGFDKQITNTNTVLLDIISKQVSGNKQDADPEFSEEYFKNRLHFYINGYSFGSPFVATHHGLFDEENRLICESDDSLFVIEKDEKSEADRRVYFCTVKNKDDFYNYLESCRDYTGEETYSNYSIARKGFECYITSLTCSYTEGNKSLEAEYIYDGAIEPGFETVVPGDNITILQPIENRPEFIGYTSYFLTGYKSLMERNNKKYYEITNNIQFSEGRSDSKDYNYFGLFGTDSTRETIQTVYGNDGKEYHLISVNSFNMGAFFLFAIVAFVVIALIVSATTFTIIKVVKTKRKKTDNQEIVA